MKVKLLDITEIDDQIRWISGVGIVEYFSQVPWSRVVLSKELGNIVKMYV